MQGQQGSASPTQPREPGTPAPMQSQRPAKHQSQPHRLHPGSRRSGEGERRGEKREGAHRKSQHYSTAQHLHPMRPPPRRSTHAASRPSIPGQTASPESAQHQGIQFRFCGVCRTALDQRRPRYPREGKARGILYILSATATAKNPPCTPFSTPLNFSPTQNPYITPLVIVLIFGFMIFRLRTRFLHVDHRTFLWISDFPAFILTGGFGKEIAVDYRTESLSYPYKE